MYLGILFILTQLFGRTYSIEITPTLLITGGNIAYSAFLATYMIVIFTTVDLKSIRAIFYMLILLSLFISLIYIMISFLFEKGQIINTLNIPNAFYEQSIGSNLVSIVVFIVELFGLFFLLEIVKKAFKKRFLLIISSVVSYYIILILDGILFPLGMRILYPSLEISIAIGIIVKIICGSGFCILLGIYFTLFYSNIKQYIENPQSVSLMFISKSQLIKKLEDTQEEVQKLQNILPICAKCKKIRDDEGYWNQVEGYISSHSEIKFSHELCPDCAKELLSELDNNKS